MPLVHRLIGATVSVVALLHGGAVRADWRPEPESNQWRELRTLHLPDSQWQFMDAIRTERLEAAEYIRAPRHQGDTVAFDAGLLLRKAGQRTWTSRILPMRAVCVDDRLERRSSDGTWSAYPGRPDTAVKVRWICALP
ncbi:MAG: hypothetical protein CL863_04605 [Cyanobium sp. RS427]|nr:hypothetical protein [Cyanobium sp. RS427]